MKFTSNAVLAGLLVGPLASQAAAPRKLNGSAALDRNPPIGFAVLKNTISHLFDPSAGGASPVPFESLTNSFIATGTRRSKGDTQAAIAALDSAGTDAGDEISEFLKSTNQSSNASASAASKAKAASVPTTKAAAKTTTTTTTTAARAASTSLETDRSTTMSSTPTPAKNTSVATAMHEEATTTMNPIATAATAAPGTTTVFGANATGPHAKALASPLSKLPVPAAALAANASTRAASSTTTTTKLAEKDVDSLPMAGFAEDDPTTTATTTSTPVNASAPSVHKLMANISEAVIAHPGLNQTVSMADAVASLDSVRRKDAKAKDVALSENSTEKEREMQQLRKEITAQLRPEFEAQLRDQLHQALQETTTTTTASTTTTTTTSSFKTTATTTATTSTRRPRRSKATTTTTTSTRRPRHHKATTTHPTTTSISTQELDATTTMHKTAHRKSGHQRDRSRRKHFQEEAERLQSIAHERILDLHRPEPALTQFERLQQTQAAARSAAEASERSAESVARADGATATTTEGTVAGWLAPIAARARGLLASLLGRTGESRPSPPPASAAALLQSSALERLTAKQSAARTAAKVAEEQMENIAISDEWSDHEAEDADKLQELAATDREERIRAATKETPHFLSPAEIHAQGA